METTQPGGEDWGYNVAERDVVVYAGGIPLYDGDDLLGAAGASGGTAAEDEECVTAAALSLGFAISPASAAT